MADNNKISIKTEIKVLPAKKSIDLGKTFDLIKNEMNDLIKNSKNSEQSSERKENMKMDKNNFHSSFTTNTNNTVLKKQESKRAKQEQAEMKHNLMSSPSIKWNRINDYNKEIERGTYLGRHHYRTNPITNRLEIRKDFINLQSEFLVTDCHSGNIL